MKKEEWGRRTCTLSRKDDGHLTSSTSGDGFWARKWRKGLGGVDAHSSWVWTRWPFYVSVFAVRAGDTGGRLERGSPVHLHRRSHGPSDFK